MTAPLRSPRGTFSLCGSIFSMQSGGFELGDDLLARLEAVECRDNRSGAFVVELRVGREDVDQRQVVALADLVVVEIVRRRDLHAARAECRVDVRIGDDRESARPVSGSSSSLPTSAR